MVIVREGYESRVNKRHTFEKVLPWDLLSPIIELAKYYGKTLVSVSISQSKAC